MEKKLFLLKIQIFDVNELVECNLFVQLQHLGYFFDTSITPFFFFHSTLLGFQSLNCGLVMGVY